MFRLTVKCQSTLAILFALIIMATPLTAVAEDSASDVMSNMGNSLGQQDTALKIKTASAQSVSAKPITDAEVKTFLAELETLLKTKEFEKYMTRIASNAVFVVNVQGRPEIRMMRKDLYNSLRSNFTILGKDVTYDLDLTVNDVQIKDDQPERAIVHYDQVEKYYRAKKLQLTTRGKSTILVGRQEDGSLQILSSATNAVAEMPPPKKK